MKKRYAHRDFSDICDKCFEFILKGACYVLAPNKPRHYECHQTYLKDLKGKVWTKKQK